MERIAFSVGNINIYWYSITMFLGVLLGIIVATIEFRRHGYKLNELENMLFYAILFGFVGARIYYVLFNLDYYLSKPIEIVCVWHGGLAIHGAIIASSITLFYFCKKHKFDFWKIMDICAPALLIGQIIGRWGNFFNSEAHGGVVTRAFLEKIHIPEFIIKGMYIDGVYYHPTFFYESCLNLICFIVLMILRFNKKIKDGMIVSIYLMWYGIVRFFIESMRTDALMLGTLKMAQLISITLFIIGLVLFIFSIKHDKYNKEMK